MKTVFVIAGFDLHETAASTSGYKTLLDGLRVQGYNVIPYTRAWYRKNPIQYVREFEEFYIAHKTDENIIIGNSFGAVVAFVSAPKLQPNTIFLCSLSPFFKEDRGKYPDEYAYKYFGKKRAHELWSYSSNDIVTEINKTGIRVIGVYGEKEHKTSPNLVARTTNVARKLNDAELIEVPDAPHVLENSIYTAAILKMV